VTRKEAIRRLERLAVENGYKRNHYVKRALVEFLENREPLLVGGRSSRTGTGGLAQSLGALSPRLDKFPY